MDRPLCFVLMPFGAKKDPSGTGEIQFDTIYQTAIRPAIVEAGMEPVRADEERTGGIIHKAMFERLLLCDYAVADLTTANANVFYELGIRHAVRPQTTLAIFSDRQQPPFDVNFLRALPYDPGEGNRFADEEAERLRTQLASRLQELRDLAREEPVADSPVFTLLEDYRGPDLARLKTDTFRDRVRYSVTVKKRLEEARRQGDASVLVEVEESLGELDGVEAGILIDLFLSYRAVQEWERMIELYERFPATLSRSILAREQLAFALNRAGRREEALQVLEEVVEEQGPSSETCGLMGRVYKDLWVEAHKEGREPAARAWLDKAIEAYRTGFVADWRDAYPGINAVTLLDIRGDEESLRLQAKLLPVVRFAVEQRLVSSQPDYWDHATLLELAVLERDDSTARQKLGDCLIYVRESWEPETTANNLRLIRQGRLERGVSEEWLDELIEELESAAGR